MKTATFALLALLQTGASFDASQRRHPTKRTMALQVTRVEQAMGNGLRRLYRLPKLTTAPSKATGVSAKDQATKDGITMLRVARLMRQTAAILTLSGALTLIQATYLALTQDWSKIFDALGMIDDFTISYWLMVGAAAFEAITNAKNADDIDYTETILKPMESLWASVRLPLLIPVLMLAYECRTAVVAAAGAVQGLFAAAPEPVAEPAKRGLFALFGR